MDALLEHVRAAARTAGASFTDTRELIEELAALDVQRSVGRVSDSDACSVLATMALRLRNEIDRLEQRCSSLEAALEIAVGKEST